MNRILKLKNSLLAQAASSSDVPISKILHDTKFLLYCFRHYNYVDNSFNLKISNSILNNIDKYPKQIDKSQAISLFTQIYLQNGLKISSTQSQILVENMKSAEIPNLRWLINLAVIFQNSDISSPTLWEIVEEHFVNDDFASKKKTTAEELQKLAYVLSSDKNNSPEIWNKLMNDLISVGDTFNSSQRVMLIKSLSNIKHNIAFTSDFLAQSFNPYLRTLVDTALKQKELLAIKELVGLLVATEKVRLLNENILVEIEEILFTKGSLIPKKSVYDLMKIYTKANKTKGRKDFLKVLRRTLVTKFDKNVDEKDAQNFNSINTYLFKNGIISSQEYNDPYSQLILDDKLQAFELLFVSRMKSSSVVDIMNLSVSIQGQLSKSILQLNPETLIRVFSFFDIRGELSESFMQIVFDAYKKYLKPVQERHVKQQVYAYLIYFKYDPTFLQRAKLKPATTTLLSILEQQNDRIILDETLRFVCENQQELHHEFLKEVKSFYIRIMDNLNDETLYNLFSMIDEKDLKDIKLKEKLEDYLIHNLKYMNVLALCNSHHLIKTLLTKEYSSLAVDAIEAKRLNLGEIEVLTRKLDLLRVESRAHVQECLRIERENIDWRKIGTVAKVIVRVFKNSKDFEQSFIQELLETVSINQSYFNQKSLDKLIGTYADAKN